MGVKMLHEDVRVTPRYINDAMIPGPVKTYTKEEIEAFEAERNGQPLPVPKTCKKERKRKD